MSREVRICENCGYENDVTSLECLECGYDLSFVIPTIKKIEGEEQSGRWGIYAEGEENISTEIKGTVVIGREGDIFADYVNKSDYVSREHAKLFVASRKLYVVDASVNGTYINGERIGKLHKYELKEGDEVSFADIKFIVWRK